MILRCAISASSERFANRIQIKTPLLRQRGFCVCRRHTLHRGPLRWALCGRDCSSLQRTHCTPKAPNAHVCEPSGIFSAVHAARENDWNFFASADANSARLRDVTELFGRPAAEARPRVRAETRLYDVTNAAGREKARVHCTRAAFRKDLVRSYLMPYFLLNLSTRPLVSTSFCLPV